MKWKSTAPITHYTIHVHCTPGSKTLLAVAKVKIQTMTTAESIVIKLPAIVDKCVTLNTSIVNLSEHIKYIYDIKEQQKSTERI